MKRILLIVPVLLLFSMCTTVNLTLSDVESADRVEDSEARYEAGLDAFNRQDYTNAVDVWRPLAEEGDTRAQYYLGVMCEEGNGVLEDDGEAVRWYRLAAEQGVAAAQNNLGWRCQNGFNIPEDDGEAVKWYTLAAEQGDADAQFLLGLMYYAGEGVSENHVYAYMWLNIASSLGDENATEGKELVESRMARSQIEKAQELSLKCLNSIYRDCD